MKYFTVYDLFKEIGREPEKNIKAMNKAGEHLKALSIEVGIPTFKKHSKPLECMVVHYPEEHRDFMKNALIQFRPKRKRITKKVEKINNFN